MRLLVTPPIGNKAMILACCPLIILLLTQLSFAASPLQIFKRDVIEDCMAAKLSLPKMQEQERVDSVNYLTKVAGFRLKDESLRDQLSILGIAAAGKNVVGSSNVGSSSIIARDEMVRSLDPSKEEMARGCALEILSSLLPYSIESIPDLVALLDRDSEVSNDSLFPVKLRLTLQALSTGLNDFPSAKLSDIFWEKLINHATEAESLVVRSYALSILKELRDLSLPRVKQRILGNLFVSNLNTLVKLLISINEDPNPSRDLFHELLLNEKTEIRILALDSIASYPRANWHAAWIDMVISRLSDFSPGVRSSAVSALSKIFTDLSSTNSNLKGAIKLDAEQIDLLFNAFINSDGPDKYKLAFATNSLSQNFGENHREKAVSKLIEHILSSTEISLEKSELAVILELGGNRPNVSSLLEKALLNSNSQTRRLILGALTRYPKLVATLKKPIAKLIQQAKSNSATADQLAAIADIINALPADSIEAKELLSPETATELLKLSPRVLSDGQILDKIIILARIAGERAAIEVVLKNLRMDQDRNRILAITLAKALGIVNREILNALIVNLSKTEQISNSIQITLARYFRDLQVQQKLKSEIARIKSLLKLPSVEKSLAIKLSLSGTDFFTLKSIDTFSPEFKALPCSQRAKLSEFITPISNELDLAIIECISDPSLIVQEEIFSWILAHSPLDLDKRGRLISSLVSVKPHPKTLINLLDNLKTLGISNQEATPLWLSLLNNDDRLAQIEALDRLYTHPEVVAELGDSFRGLESSFSDVPTLSREVKLLIALQNPQDTHVKDFLVDKFKEQDITWALDRLTKIPRVIAANILEKAFPELSIPNEIPILKTIGALKLVELKPRVEARLDSSFGDLRYAAVVSLIKIDPNNPRIRALLERELFGEFRDQLIAETFPSELKSTLEDLSANSPSLVVKQNATLMIERLPA